MAPKDIDLHAFDYVIGKITDGFIFEDLYQFSIEADPRSKFFRSLNGLRKRSVQFGRFFYVTNRHVREQDRPIEEVYD
jgi:hypothetical protein